MDEYRTQRNVLLIVIAVIGAVALGFYLGRSGDSRPVESAMKPEAEAPHAAIQPVPAPAEGTSVETSPPPPSPTSPAVSAPLTKPAPRTPPVARPSAPVPAEPSEVPAAVPESAEAPYTAPAPPEPREILVMIPAGTKIELELTGGVSSQTAQVGDRVMAEVGQTVWVDGRAVIPAGARAEGRVTEVHPLAKVGGKAVLAVTFDQISLAGEDAPIVAGWRHEGKSETGKDAATIAAGAAVGAVAGNQSKSNDKGKAIGALLGAGLGTLIASKTPGETVELPAGSHLTLTLREPVEVRLKY